MTPYTYIENPYIHDMRSNNSATSWQFKKRLRGEKRLWAKEDEEAEVNFAELHHFILLFAGDYRVKG